MLDALLNPSIKIFGFPIYVYAIIIVCGMVAAFIVISLLFRRRNMSKDLFLTYFCISLPVALITTRLFYCITDGVEFKYWFSFDEQHGIRAGGLSIIGGIIGGAASVALISYFKKVNFFRVADCVAVGLLLAQAIGRWANFANQEVYGGEVTNTALQCFPFAVYINKTDGGNCLQTFTLTFAKWFGKTTDISGGTWHYAFFFYESLCNFLLAIALFINAWKNPKKPNGVNVSLYFIGYGLVRSIMEPLRDASYILSGGAGGSGIKWSQVVSLIMLFGGLVMLAFVLWRNRKKEGAFFGSVNGDPYGIADYIADTKDEIPYFDKINMMCKVYPEKYPPKPVKEAKTPEKTEASEELGEAKDKKDEDKEK